MTAAGTASVVAVALAANLASAVAALWAAAWTGSSALLALAIAALVAASSQGLLLVGLRRSERPPDATQPRAGAAELRFWSFVVPILLFALGAGVALAEGIGRLRDPWPVTDPLIATAALALTLVLQGTSAAKAIAALDRRELRGPKAMARFREVAEPPLFATVIESFTVLTCVTVAAIGVALSRALASPAPDAWAAVAIGLLLGAVAAIMSIEVRRALVGEAARPTSVPARVAKAKSPSAEPAPAATKGEPSKEHKRRKLTNRHSK